MNTRKIKSCGFRNYYMLKELYRLMRSVSKPDKRTAGNGV